MSRFVVVEVADGIEVAWRRVLLAGLIGLALGVLTTGACVSGALVSP